MNRVVAPAALAALALTAACGSGSAEVAEVPITLPPASPEPAAADMVLSVDFDGTAEELVDGAPVADASGRHMMGTVRLGGSSPEPLSAVPRGPGQALRFTSSCTSDGTASDACPKGIVEFPATTLLNPEQRDFRYGASVLIAEDETSDGSNIMQKGFSAGGRSQWKLQVDGDKGHPSCVIVGTGEDEFIRVTAKTGVADGTWHDIECRRTEGDLVVLVDGVESNRKPVPDGISVEPPSAVRIGGKSTKGDNDQYYGVLDDVFVEILVGPT